MKKFFATFYLLLAATTLLALDWNDDKTGFLSLDALQKAAAEATSVKYPNADTVELDNVQAVEYQTDGRYIQVMDHAVKVMTQAGTDSMRVLASYYSANYSRAKISLVQILKADGKVIDIDLANCTQEMTEPSQMQSNIYDPNQKVINVSIPNLQPGDTIRAIYVDEIFKPRVPYAFANFFQLEAPAPSLHTKIVVTAPKELPLRKIAVKDPQNGGPTFTKTEDDAHITYTWEVSEVKQYFPEPAMPGASNYLQRLLISTFDSWEQVSRWYDDLCEKHLVADNEIKEAVKGLTADAKDDMAKILALYNFVSQKVRYMGLTLENTAPGYEPHDVALTFQQRAGVCRDMAALLAAMLRCAGFDAHPVLIQVGDRKDEEVPIFFFNHAITAVRHPETGDWMLMDPTNSNTMEPFPAYLSESSYLVATPEGDPIRLSPVTPYQDNLIDISTAAEIALDGSMQANSTLSFTGIMDNAYRNGFLSMQPDERRIFFERKLAEAIPNAKVTALKITPENLQDMTANVKAEIAYEIQNCLISKTKKDGSPDCVPGNTAMLRIPNLNSAFGLNMLVFRSATLAKRRFPLKASNTAGVTENISIDLPDELELVSNIEYSPIDNDCFTISRTMKPRRNRVDINATYASKVIQYSPDDYLKLKKALAVKDAEDRKMLLLKFREPITAKSEEYEKATEIHDLQTLEYSEVTTIESPSSWTTETTLKFLVKTYAGIEIVADSIFNYNPAWEEINILKASVTNGENTIELPPENMNRMDASWVASAPRYPAEKQLVVNLPGIDVGSIVELKIQRKYSHRPFFMCVSTIRKDFPIDNFSLAIIAPKDMNLRQQFLPNGWLDMPNDLETPVKLIQRTEKIDGGKYKFSFESKDIPALHQEPNRPPAYAYLPTIVCTTGDWFVYANDLKKYIYQVMEDSASIRKLAAELKGDTTEKTVTAIRDWIEKNIRTEGPSLTKLPLSCLSTPETTLRDGYGNSFDVALLYLALFDASGIYAEPYLATSTPQDPQLQKFYRQNPMWTLFDDCIVKANVNGKDVWLNDQDQYAHLGTCAYDRCMTLSLEDGKIKVPESAAEFRNEALNEWLLDIQADGTAMVTVRETINGTDFGRWNRFFQQLTPEERRRYYIQLVSKIAQDATPVTQDITTDFSSYPAKISYTVKIPNCASFDGDFCYIRLPISLGNALNFTRPNRQFHPFYSNSFSRETTILIVRLPADYPKVVLAPTDFIWRAPDNNSSISWKGNTTTPEFDRRREYQFTYSVNMAPGVSPQRLYKDYQNAFRFLTHPNETTILLSK